MKTCAHCGASFEPHKRAARRQQFCSTNCAGNASYRRLNGPSVIGSTRTCEHCSEGFAVAHGLQKYCSSFCKGAAARVKVPQRWRHVSHRYGIPPKRFDEMMIEQNRQCAICATPLLGVVRDRDAPQVDHDHGTGQVRAILCRLCNTALGNFRDDPDLVASALAYLLQWKTSPQKVP